MVGLHELFLTLAEQLLKTVNAFSTCRKLAVSNGDLLLELGVLLDQLPLHLSQLFQVTFEEGQLLLLLLAIC
ncbi:hypothetical protein KCV03_g264, partial [Aureobasidium melanogenum]|jgi:hypothetical protein